MATEETLEEATAKLIASDPELRDELRGLVREAIQRYRHTIRWGQPDARLSAIKAIVPGMMRAMGRVESTEADRQLRVEYDMLRAAFMPAKADTPKPAKAAKPKKKPAAG